MIVFMALVSVSEAAERLGVNVPRVHQRIADGSLRAQRIGAQWVVDERSLLEVAERREAGRPLSARSAWAVIAASEEDEAALSSLAPSERSRARQRLRSLLDRGSERAIDEEAAREISVVLRSMFRGRAERRLFRVAAGDLEDLRVDERWQAVVDSAASGIASRDVDGYASAEDADHLVKGFLLVPALDEANVVVHVLPDGQIAYPASRLRLAADLAEHRGPREEARAAEILHVLARERDDR